MQSKSISSAVQTTRIWGIAILIVSAIVIVTIMAERYYFGVQYSRVMQLQKTADTYSAKAILDDEILTTSARLYATTGDPQWTRRYDAANTDIEKAYNELIAISPPDALPTIEKMAAAGPLSKLEKELIEKASAGDNAGALAILESAVYLNAKKNMADLTTSYMTSLNAYLEKTIQRLETQNWFVRAASLLALMIVCSVSWRLNQNLNAFEREYEAVEEARTVSAQGQAEAEQNAKLARTASEQRQAIQNAAVHQFQANMAKTRDVVSGHACELDRTSGELISITNATIEKMQATSQATEDSLQSARNIHNAAQELQASISDITNQINEINEASRLTTELARKSNLQISTFTQAAKRVGSIVEMIDAVAEKTNLLALNATIEAARSGEAGKGFAVVASEVKALASQTAQATFDISAQINDIRTMTSEAVASMEQVVNNAEATQNSVMRISAVIQQQSATTSEVSHSASQGVSNVDQVNALIQKMHETLELASRSATNITNVSSGLNQSSEELDASITDFLKAAS